MSTVGLRELRQGASALVRRAEAGEDITVTVAGRPSVRLVPVRRDHWRSWADVAELFDGPGDPEWAGTRVLVDDATVDPWDRR